jgi:hypothetical protein
MDEPVVEEQPGMDEEPAGDAARLEHEIEVTRQNMQDTLSQLKEKVTLHHFMNEAGRQVGDGVQALRYAAQRHPVVLGTVAIVAAGVLVGNRRSAAAHRLANADGLSQLLEVLAAQVAGLSAHTAQAARESTQNVGELAAAAANHDGLGEIARSAQSGSRFLQDLARREPLLFGLSALGVGTVAGAILRRII